jgi:hypothetical protein
MCSYVCVFITAVPNTKLCAWGEEDSGVGLEENPIRNVAQKIGSETFLFFFANWDKLGKSGVINSNLPQIFTNRFVWFDAQEGT